MSDRSSVVRTASSLSLAAWFGGSILGLVGLPRAVDGPVFEDDGGNRGHDDGAVVPLEGSAWSAWQPIQTGAIASQLASGAVLTLAHRRGAGARRGGTGVSVVRVALTGAAIGATALAARSERRLGRAIEDQTRPEADEPAEGVVEGTDLAAIERRTRALQVAVPVLTGTLLAIDTLTDRRAA